LVFSAVYGAFVFSFLSTWCAEPDFMLGLPLVMIAFGGIAVLSIMNSDSISFYYGGWFGDAMFLAGLFAIVCSFGLFFGAVLYEDLLGAVIYWFFAVLCGVAGLWWPIVVLLCFIPEEVSSEPRPSSSPRHADAS
jgi:hypothetical protein